jgi:hypothetical protein
VWGRLSPSFWPEMAFGESCIHKFLAATPREFARKSFDPYEDALATSKNNLFWTLARELDRYLRQNETSRLEPWHHEIRDYLRSGRMPTLSARDNLAVWARRKRLSDLNSDTLVQPSKRATRLS